jgi:hypothetical protein
VAGAAVGDGLVDASGYDVTATNSSFRGNVLGGGDGRRPGRDLHGDGGGIGSASVSLDGVTVSDNAIGVGAAGGTGGAVSLSTSANNATLVAAVVRSAILDNDVGGQGGLGFGGAINATATGSGDRVDVGVERSTISNNRVGVGTGGVGGAISISSSGSGTTSCCRPG